MVYRKISDDLKEAALRLDARGHDNAYQIAAITGFSVRTFYRIRAQKLQTGTVAKAAAIGRGRPRTLLRRDCEYLLRLARHKPTLFLDEYSKRLQQNRELSMSMAIIHQTLERAGLNVKHVQKLAAERDPFLRADFRRRIGQYPANYIISIDEVSKDDRTYTRLWGRAQGIIASRVLEGSFHHDTFLEYLRDDVVSWW
ncbi:hypothetical protein HYPSUDRAFT_132666 [Hypholoma sublateritium FD-334 SS-4]|uniref:Tc1-like transposase DDE domain-containing protein n=1 Tax=Hypholoma sublateritium (strain FD-334 SS-4) TaxID=945553 RepID=A0A0D2MR46_HYPSF|nr:hypothetical protein HYPSUDRAFT_132666 [Hypholoma sublateritium FD-334 SS-4]